jgi:hypothetical protein
MAYTPDSINIHSTHRQGNQMESYRWFWTLLAIAALAWYSTITIYISYQGVIDIKHLLKKLSKGEFDPDSPEA